MTKTFIPKRIGIVGLGLIGGSFAKAYASAGFEVYAQNRTHATLELAMVETIDGELTQDLIKSCELIILAGYPKYSISWLEDMQDEISDGALVIDAVGVKRKVCEACFAIADKHDWNFIGAHPMAGTQYSGFGHARKNMFKGAPLVLCPPNRDDIFRAELLLRLKELLAPCGFGSFTLTDPAFHDAQIAYTSQLAHVVSNAYVKSPRAQEHHGFSAGSYKDLTRVARLNADMWTELFLDNRDNLVTEIDTLIKNLASYKEALEQEDAERLHELLREGDELKRTAEKR